jgi:hypothetical protein
MPMLCLGGFKRGTMYSFSANDARLEVVITRNHLTSSNALMAESLVVLRLTENGQSLT